VENETVRAACSALGPVATGAACSILEAVATGAACSVLQPVATPMAMVIRTIVTHGRHSIAFLTHGAATRGAFSDSTRAADNKVLRMWPQAGGLMGLFVQVRVQFNASTQEPSSTSPASL
jgi:hypothetical protein